MKNLLALAGCGLVAFAIGCGGETKPTSTAPAMDPAKMQEMMMKTADPTKAGEAAKAEGDAKADDAKADDAKGEEKKEEPKADDAKPEEKKEEAKADDKKDEEKKEEK